MGTLVTHFYKHTTQFRCGILKVTSSFSHITQLKVSVKRVRRHFGAPCSFTNRDSGQTKQSVIECLSYEDRGFDLKKVELDSGIQVMFTICFCGLGIGSVKFKGSVLGGGGNMKRDMSGSQGCCLYHQCAAHSSVD